MKKSRAAISQSPIETREKINELFDNGGTLQAAADLFENLTGKAISHKAAESYYHGEYQMHRIQSAKVNANRIAAAVGNEGELDRGVDALVAQKSFEAMVKPGASIQEITALGMMLLNVRKSHADTVRLEIEKKKQETSEEKLKIEKGRAELELRKYQDKVAASKAAIEKTLKSEQKKGGLTPETMVKIQEELNLL